MSSSGEASTAERASEQAGEGANIHQMILENTRHRKRARVQLSAETFRQPLSAK